MSWLTLAWMLVVVALVSWILANALIVTFSSHIRQSSFEGIRRHLWVMAMLPWFLPLLAVITLLTLAFAKRQGWIYHHCETHLAHHPHFCFEHLPELALQLSNSIHGLLVVLCTVFLLVTRCLPIFKLHAISKSFQRLVSNKRVVKTLAEERPLAFTLGGLKPSIFISKGLRKLLSRRELRIVFCHEVAHARHMDVGKNIIFELLLSLHAFPSLLQPSWYLSSELRADRHVTAKFDALEVAAVLIKLRRLIINTPFSASVVGGQLSERVRVLLNAEHACSAPGSIGFLYLLVLAFPIALLIGHHSLETLWGWLLWRT